MFYNEHERIEGDISKVVTGREFHELDAMNDALLIFKLARKATIVRYIRMGADLKNKYSAAELDECTKLAEGVFLDFKTKVAG
jgi:hypothetical protein